MNYVAVHKDSNDFLAWFESDIAVGDVLEKAGDSSPQSLLAPISGIASSESADADEDEIEQDGLDWQFALSKGIFTYEHPIDISRLAGYPERVSRVTLPNGRLATRIEGQLYLNRPYGKLVYDTQKAMAQAGGRRSLGFSIEGRVLKGGRKGKKITHAQVLSVAISPAPKNPDTWCDLAASMFARTTPMEKAARHVVADAVLDTGSTQLNLEQITHRLVREFRILSWEQAEKLAKAILAG